MMTRRERKQLIAALREAGVVLMEVNVNVYSPGNVIAKKVKYGYAK